MMGTSNRPPFSSCFHNQPRSAKRKADRNQIAQRQPGQTKWHNAGIAPLSMRTDSCSINARKRPPTGFSVPAARAGGDMERRKAMDSNPDAAQIPTASAKSQKKSRVSRMILSPPFLEGNALNRAETTWFAVEQSPQRTGMVPETVHDLQQYYQLGSRGGKSFISLYSAALSIC